MNHPWCRLPIARRRARRGQRRRDRGRMRQRDRLGRAVESERMRAGDRSGPRRRDVNRTGYSRRLHRAADAARGAGRRVALGRVVHFVNPGAELRPRRANELCRERGERNEQVDADREVRRRRRRRPAAPRARASLRPRARASR